MKITVVCKGTEWQVERLKEAATTLGVDIEVRDLTEPGIVPKNLGDVVLWRSSSLGKGPGRLEAMRAILKKHLLINRCLALFPQAAEKAFQQEHVQQKTQTVKGIPTFRFRSKEEIALALKNETLRYPFIQKPNTGSKGKGVELIRGRNDWGKIPLDMDQQVYQNFIANTGDYRAFVLGGRMLGAIKRTAQKGGFLNNISLGGSAEQVTDPKILTKLNRISTTVASVFELTLCGVDIIFDETNQEYYFLEVNTVPQWKGFQNATGIDVAREIVQYCQRVGKRKSRPTVDLVSEEYASQISFLGEKRFHYLSRLYLWNGDKAKGKKLQELQPKYIGTTEGDYRKKLQEIFTQIPEHGDRMVAKKARQIYFKKYPLLEPALGLLFKNLFAREIYRLDFRPYIRELVSAEDLLTLKFNLEKDEEALRTLSTHAINYLYMLEAYLETEEAKTDPAKYLLIGKSYPTESSELQIYFFTHCIIGASRFYTRKIPESGLELYRRMLHSTEEIIQNNFFAISLDNKFEFLVCAKICGYVSGLEEKILAEANQSLSPDGNFLIDTRNAKASPDGRNDFVGAEHRNVLYLMAHTEFRPRIQS